MEIIKSPQDNLEAYLCNSINIEIYKELTKIDSLEFFNKLYYEFDFFQQNIKNYLKIINHFEGFDSLEEHNKLKEYPFLENYVFYFYESLNKLITKHYPVESREDRIIKSCEHIEEIYKRLSISVYGTYSQFESFLEEIEDFEDEAKIKSLIEFKYLSLKNPQIFISNQGIPFDEKCELEIHRLKELLKLESQTFITLPAEPEPLDLSNTSAVEKIIYLNELGIIDFLRAKPEFMGSTNLMATFLSAITDEKATTLQTSINRLINNDAADNNHPYKAKGTANKIRQTLIDKNIKPKTS